MEDNKKIIFKEKETKYLNSYYDNVLIVSVRMINAKVKRIMIDIDNSIDILYFDAFKKLELSTNYLTLITSLLMGFTSDSISSPRIMNLYVIFGDEACSKTLLAKFIVVNIFATYNMIIG